jgi:hypothetical protein
MRTVLCLLLGACGTSPEDFGQDYAEEICDYAFDCPGNDYDSRDECLAEHDVHSADFHPGCEFVQDLADDCLDGIRDARKTCDEDALVAAEDEACVRAWDCGPASNPIR